MIYYINVTSWNLLESFVTESLSPHAFYSERSFGNNLSRYLDGGHELSEFLVLSTRETKSEYSILVDEELLDKESLSPVRSHSTLFTYNKTIYYKKGLVSFRFSTEDLLNALEAEAHILLDVKCIEKYKADFFIGNRGYKSVDVSSKLSNGLSFDRVNHVSIDNKFNVLKGAIIGYARGILTSSNSSEQALKSDLVAIKNLFAGLNTSIMMSGDAVQNPDSIIMSIQKAKSAYDILRQIKTNLFDILLQQFKEIQELALKRSEELSANKFVDKVAEIKRLEDKKEEIEHLIYGIEVDNNLSDLLSELECIKDQERMNGMKVGKSRLYFKKGTHEYERKAYLKEEISRFESTHSEYKSLLEQKREINDRIFKLSSNSTIYDNVILGIFARISDIINDLIKKVNDTEELNDVTLNNIEVQSNGNICVKVASASQAEVEYFNVALSYIIANPTSEPISDALILNLIKETGIIYKSLPSSSSAEGNAILQCLRQYWGYKNRRVPSFSIPNDLNVFQSIMSFYVKPFGYDQIERYMLNKRYAEKSYAFMLWGACLGYASLPKTFTNIIYQDSELYKPIDEYLETIRKGLLE